MNRFISPDDEKNKINIKGKNKILCYSMLTKKICPYQDKCFYAHNLKSQVKNEIRQKAYDLIETKEDLSKINLIENNELYNTLICLSKVCQNCVQNCCTGGYNCKYGALDGKYQICISDLNNGNCKYTNCKKVHLTKKGLICYHKQQTLMKENLIKNRLKSKENIESSESISEDENEIRKMIKYLNESESESESESIFD